MKRLVLSFLLMLSAMSGALAQGTLPLALQQQFSFSGCSTTSAACGTPLSGGLLYFYVVGTVATPQNSYQDSGLTVPNPFPLVLDSNGRVPAFYLASGSVHVRLTDANGVVQFDYPLCWSSALPEAEEGGGGSVDPTTVSSTGDIKFRATSETLTGWVKSERPHDRQCGVRGDRPGERGYAKSLRLPLGKLRLPDIEPALCRCRRARRLGARRLQRQQTTALFDFRASIPVGLDDMGEAAAGKILSSNVTSGGGDGPTTPNATGGEANHTLVAAEFPRTTTRSPILVIPTAFPRAGRIRRRTAEAFRRFRADRARPALRRRALRSTMRAGEGRTIILGPLFWARGS